MSLHPRLIFKRRETITALPLYYSGHLQKKSSKDKDFKKYYGELRGTTLFLYQNDTQDTYTEKMDLEKLKSMEPVNPYPKKVPVFTLFLQTEEVHLKMDNPETGMEWNGFILTVTKKEIPSKLQLLPGQKLELQDVLAKERKRNNPTQRPPLPPRPAFLQSASSASPPPPKDEPDLIASEMPVCFFNVSRSKAEQMLEENPEYGSIILRPSALANNYALTIRQLKQSEGVMKNYRVTSTNSGFVIELDVPVTVSSLNDVVDYFLEKTEYRLQPYRPFQPYDTRIDVSHTPKCISITSTAHKAVPSAQVAPMQRSETKEELSCPPTKPEEGDYVIPDDNRPEHHDLKRADLDGELRQVLKVRRENIYAANDEGKVVTCQKKNTKNSPPRTATWSKNSSVV